MNETMESLQNWFLIAQPSPAEALTQADDARARGRITRDEYLALLDAWPDSAGAREASAW